MDVQKRRDDIWQINEQRTKIFNILKNVLTGLLVSFFLQYILFECLFI